MTESPFFESLGVQCYRFPDGFIGRWEGVGSTVRRQPHGGDKVQKWSPGAHPASVSCWCHHALAPWRLVKCKSANCILDEDAPPPPSLAVLFCSYPFPSKAQMIKVYNGVSSPFSARNITIKRIFISSFGQPEGSSNRESLYLFFFICIHHMCSGALGSWKWKSDSLEWS